MNEKTFKKLETSGGLVVFAIASFLHFFYDITGRSVLGALLGSVNESVWEHLKIFALSYLIWAIVELLCTQPPFKAFVWAKAVGVYYLCISISLFFYLYTGVFGKTFLVADMISALIFSFISHFISYKLTTSQRNHGQFFYTGVMLLFLMFVMILCFSYYPPKTPLFKDPVTGAYGVPAESYYQGDSTLDTLHTLRQTPAKITTKI